MPFGSRGAHLAVKRVARGRPQITAGSDEGLRTCDMTAELDFAARRQQESDAAWEAVHPGACPNPALGYFHLPGYRAGKAGEYQ